MPLCVCVRACVCARVCMSWLEVEVMEPTEPEVEQKKRPQQTNLEFVHPPDLFVLANLHQSHYKKSMFKVDCFGKVL